MISRIGVAPRRAGLEIGAFQSHWASRHAQIVAPLPGIRRYWQNHAVLRDGEPLLPWPGFDACSDFEFDDVASMDAAFASVQYQTAVRSDEAHLVDKARGGLMLANRFHVSGEIDGQGIRLLTFMRCAPGRGTDELRAALLGVPAASTARGREVFMALDTDIDMDMDGAAAAKRISIFDAIESQWFDDARDAEHYLVSPQAREHRHAIADLVRGTERLIARVVIVV